MKRIIMTEEHYKELISAAPKITWKDVQLLDKFIPTPTPIAKAVWAAFSKYRPRL